MGITLAFVMIFVLLVFIVSPISLLTVSRSLSIVSRSLAKLEISMNYNKTKKKDTQGKISMYTWMNAQECTTTTTKAFEDIKMIPSLSVETALFNNKIITVLTYMRVV